MLLSEVNEYTLGQTAIFGLFVASSKTSTDWPKNGMSETRVVPPVFLPTKVDILKPQNLQNSPHFKTSCLNTNHRNESEDFGPWYQTSTLLILHDLISYWHCWWENGCPKLQVIHANQVLAVCLNESFHALLADDLIFNAIPTVTSAII